MARELDIMSTVELEFEKVKALRRIANANERIATAMESLVQMEGWNSSN